MRFDKFQAPQPQDRRDEGVPSLREFVDLGKRLEKSIGDIQALLRDLVSPLYFSVSLSANQNVLDLAQDTVVWNVADSDDLGVVDTSTGIFTAQRPGLVSFMANVRWDNLASGDYVEALIVHNGDVVGRETTYLSAADNPRHPVITGPIEVAIGDTVEVQVVPHVAAGDVDVVAGADCWFRGFEIGRRR